MGICSEKIPEETIIKLSKSICKIKINKDGQTMFGNGFFMKYNYFKYLITCYHIINGVENFDIEIHNKRTITIDLKNYYTKLIEKPKDIAIIEIRESDIFINEITFLDYDINDISRYSQYKDKDIISLRFSYGEKIVSGKGKVNRVVDYKFEHDIDIDKASDSSGCPIILSDNLKVIGMNKGEQSVEYKDLGIFIGEIITEIELLNNNDNDQITLTYSLNKQQIRIFGQDFVKNYINKCKILHNNESYDLNEFWESNDDILTVQLTGIHSITNASQMFSDCVTLKSLPDISKWNTNNVTDMSFLLFNCSSLNTLPDISKWNTNNVNNMSNMFAGCSALISLPDISQWNTSNVTDMSYMFFGCTSLSSLPDISMWNTNNVTSICYIFSTCLYLKSLSDISKWDTKNVKDMSFVFSGCSSLISLPDISKWNTNNVINMNGFFSLCYSLQSLPDISKWNTNNVNNMSKMFFECKSLISLPDISKWNIDNVNSLSQMFAGCKSLISLPDISKWNGKKILNKSNMFFECQPSLNIPSTFL